MRASDRHQQFLTVFQKVTRMVSTTLDHQEVMETIVRCLPGLLSIDACTIRLLDEQEEAFVLGAAWGLSDEYLHRQAVDSDETLAMIQAGNPVATEDVARVDQPQFRRAALREGICSVLTLPILFRGMIIGIMRLLTRQPHTFARQEIDFAMALAEQIGIAISNARLFTRLEHQVDLLDEVQRLTQLVNSTLDPDTVLATMVERVPQVLGAKGCTIRLLNPQTNRLQLAAAHGLSQGYLERGNVEEETNIFRALSGEPVLICDIRTDDRVGYKDQMEREGIRSLLAVPVKDQGEVIGVIRVLSARQHCFTEAEVHFAVSVAEAGGTAIRNARTYRKITLLFNQIEEHERFLTNILDCIRPQLLVVDRRRRIVLANRAFVEARGRTEGDILGSDYLALCPEVHQPSLVEQALASGEPASLSMRMKSNQGPHWCERSVTPMRDGQGRVEYVIEVIRDITDQRRLAQELAQRSKLEGVIELAGTVAHEINSPLFAALGTAQLMEADLESGSELAEDLATVIRNLKTIGEMTRKMTTMTGYRHRKYVGQTKIVEL
jgi:two-component system, NtrC family, sensor kinase